MCLEQREIEVEFSGMLRSLLHQGEGDSRQKLCGWAQPGEEAVGTLAAGGASLPEVAVPAGTEYRVPGSNHRLPG